MHDIDLISACCLNSEAYAEFLVDTALRTISDRNRIRFIFGINERCVDVDRLWRIADHGVHVKVVDAMSGMGHSSMSHGTSLNEIMQHVEAPFTFIADVDIAFLLPNWDVKFASKISDDCVAVGASYRADYSSKNNFEKFQGFPNIYGSLVMTDVIRKCGVDFRPAEKTIVHVDDVLSPLCGLPVGQRWFCDTGYQLSSKLREHGYTGHALNVHTCASPHARVLIDGQRGDEYQWDDGTPALTHIGRSASRDLNTHPIALGWRRCVEKWLENEGL